MERARKESRWSLLLVLAHHYRWCRSWLKDIPRPQNNNSSKSSSRNWKERPRPAQLSFLLRMLVYFFFFIFSISPLSRAHFQGSITSDVHIHAFTTTRSVRRFAEFFFISRLLHFGALKNNNRKWRRNHLFEYSFLFDFFLLFFFWCVSALCCAGFSFHSACVYIGFVFIFFSFLSSFVRYAHRGCYFIFKTDRCFFLL